MNLSRYVSIHDYLIDHTGFDWPALLSDWAWMLPETLTVWMMNRFDDLFVVLDDRSVWMLDVGGGSFEQVAENRDDFADRVKRDQNANNWFMIPLIDKLVASGMVLRHGECFSYRKPPVISGDYTVENACIVPIVEHFGNYAAIHHQLKDVPDGTEVVLNVKR